MELGIHGDNGPAGLYRLVDNICRIERIAATFQDDVAILDQRLAVTGQSVRQRKIATLVEWAPRENF